MPYVWYASFKILLLEISWGCLFCDFRPNNLSAHGFRLDPSRPTPSLDVIYYFYCSVGSFLTAVRHEQPTPIQKISFFCSPPLFILPRTEYFFSLVPDPLLHSTGERSLLLAVKCCERRRRSQPHHTHHRRATTTTTPCMVQH